MSSRCRSAGCASCAAAESRCCSSASTTPTWELRDHSLAERAEKRFAAHALAAHRNWVGTAREASREPAAFRHHAHVDLLQRLAAGTDFTEAVLGQRAVVDELVFDRTGDRASSRAALGRLRRVHSTLRADLLLLAEAAPSLGPAQHALVLLAQPSPWEALQGDVVEEIPSAAELAGLAPDTAPMGGPAGRARS